MSTRYKVYDIVVYNHQGTLKTGTITRIIDMNGIEEELLYTLDNQVTILCDNVLKLLGNMEQVKNEVYDE